MGHGKVDVEHPDELRVRLDHLSNGLSGESLLSESPLDVVEHLRVVWVAVIEYLLERQVCLTQTVAEMLGKDPSTVCVGGLLDGVRAIAVPTDGEEWVVW